MSQQIKEAKAELIRLLKKDDKLTAEEITDYLTRYHTISNDVELMKREKMTSDVALLLTLAEQKGLF